MHPALLCCSIKSPTSHQELHWCTEDCLLSVNWCIIEGALNCYTPCRSEVDLYFFLHQEVSRLCPREQYVLCKREQIRENLYSLLCCFMWINYCVSKTLLSNITLVVIFNYSMSTLIIVTEWLGNWYMNYQLLLMRKWRQLLLFFFRSELIKILF